MHEPARSAVVEHVVASDFATTLARLRQAIAAAGLTVFATIDHAGAAQGVGLSMPPTTVLIYGHPKGGTPIMIEAPVAALDLPLRVLVHELPDGHVVVAFRPIAATLAQAGVPEPFRHRLDPAQSLLSEALGLAPFTFMANLFPQGAPGT